MIADDLTNWEKAELANILANEYADAEDLLEAFPTLAQVESFEYELFKDLVEEDWRSIVAAYDPEELSYWVEEKRFKESQEEWVAESFLEAMEYYEMKDKQQIMEFVNFYNALRCPDYATLKGYPSKRNRS
ncbi:MAG: hypothetical protein J6S99_02080 [Bacteroidales bacterium]|nr:hypothetical protein [Bacteroidales bacterium]